MKGMFVCSHPSSQVVAAPLVTSAMNPALLDADAGPIGIVAVTSTDADTATQGDRVPSLLVGDRLEYDPERVAAVGRRQGDPWVLGG